MAMSLVELNAYRASVVSAVIRAVLPHAAQLGLDGRRDWINLFTVTDHQGAEAFVEALRMAPLPGGSENDGYITCWEYANGGFCPRGERCKWLHQKKGSERQEAAAPDAPAARSGSAAAKMGAALRGGGR